MTTTTGERGKKNAWELSLPKLDKCQVLQDLDLG